MRIARCSIERSDLPVGRTLTVTGTDDDDALRRALALNQPYWPGGWRDAIEDGNAAHAAASRFGRTRPDVQPCALVEIVPELRGEYLHVLDESRAWSWSDVTPAKRGV